MIRALHFEPEVCAGDFAQKGVGRRCGDNVNLELRRFEDALRRAPPQTCFSVAKTADAEPCHMLWRINTMQFGYDFDDLDIREEPARNGSAATPDLSGTFHCTTTDACSNACSGTKYCN
jgi:hypothetical protein